MEAEDDFVQRKKYFTCKDSNSCCFFWTFTHTLPSCWQEDTWILEKFAN